MSEVDHVEAALQVFNREGIEDVLIIGRRRDGSMVCATSYPEMNKAPPLALASEAMVAFAHHKSNCYFGRESVMQEVVRRVKEGT